MRILLAAVSLTAIAFTCARGVSAIAGGTALPVPAHIVVDEQSNICVSARIDRRLWGHPNDAQYFGNFSGHVMSELRRDYEQRGGSPYIPGTHNEARFLTNDNGANPKCQDRQVDVLVNVYYGARADGTPYLVEELKLIWPKRCKPAGSAAFCRVGPSGA
jgi:hypothetical protein